jgi:hypothetical protein
VTFTLVFDVALVALVLFRQRRVRRVPRHVRVFGPVVIGLIGLYQLGAFTDHHRLTASVAALLLAEIVLGAAVLGAARAVTMRLWRIDHVVLRQATWLTMGLWAVSLAVHFATTWWIGSIDSVGRIAWASLLLYVGVTLGLQGAVVQRRARSQLVAAGPVSAEAETITARWWAAAWGEGAPTGTEHHPDAIEARAEPIEPGPQGPEEHGQPR